jgi:hydrogenase small subunit
MSKDEVMKAMGLSRRDFIRATAAIGAAFGLEAAGVISLVGDANAKESATGGVPVLWLQGQACSGCSVSLLNSIFYTTIDDLAINTLDINFHPNLTAASGNLAVSQIERTYRQGSYVLVLEGAIPTGSGGKFCNLWPGMTFDKAVERYAERAAYIMGVGTCACFGGIPAAAPNPTGAHGLADYYNNKRVVKVPGCPVHPDWVVGTVAYILANGSAPALDTYGRPTTFFGRRLHGSWCPFYDTEEVSRPGTRLGCTEEMGCKGPRSYCDCNTRLWNGGAAGAKGVSWCSGVNAVCLGCSEPTFPDGMSPFYRMV